MHLKIRCAGTAPPALRRLVARTPVSPAAIDQVRTGEGEPEYFYICKGSYSICKPGV